MNHTLEKKGATKTACENGQIMLDLIDKAFKVTIINMFKELKGTSLVVQWLRIHLLIQETEV